MRIPKISQQCELLTDLGHQDDRGAVGVFHQVRGTKNSEVKPLKEEEEPMKEKKWKSRQSAMFVEGRRGIGTKQMEDMESG